MRLSTSIGLWPEPFASRMTRPGSLSILALVLSSSFSLMLSMMVMNFFIMSC